MKILTKIISLITIGIIGFGALSAPAFAVDVCDQNLPDAVKEANGCTDEKSSLPKYVTNIINSIIGILGIVAVVFIIYGGVQYMTSAGDTAKTAKAKNTILYAVIGLIVCVLAFAIVNFVINRFFEIPSETETAIYYLTK